MFGRLLRWYIIYTFWGLLPPDEILADAKFTLRPSLAVSYIASIILLNGTREVGVNQTLRRGTRNGITELSQRAPPIFGRAAITLGIGPHSNCSFGLQISSSSSATAGMADPGCRNFKSNTASGARSPFPPADPVS